MEEGQRQKSERVVEQAVTIQELSAEAKSLSEEALSVKDEMNKFNV
ncbi:MAG: hypothetical protein RR642_08085 [Solibacillus sp.]